jgi:hypothetical protein
MVTDSILIHLEASSLVVALRISSLGYRSWDSRGRNRPIEAPFTYADAVQPNPFNVKMHTAEQKPPIAHQYPSRSP